MSSKLCWIRVVRVDILVLFLVLEEKQLFTTEYARRTGRPDVLQSMGLQRIRHDWATEQQQHAICEWVCYIRPLVCWGIFLLCPLSGGFYYKWMVNFIKSFFYIFWDDHMVFILQFVDVVYQTDWFVDIEKSIHSWINSTWSWCMILLMFCWIQLNSLLLMIFPSMFISDTGL